MAPGSLTPRFFTFYLLLSLFFLSVFSLSKSMSNIRFGSQVYTWFMQGTGKVYDNKLDHMIKVAAEAGFT